MNDLENAKELLENGKYTCVLCKGDTVYVSEKRGVAPLLQWLNEGVDLKDFSVADKVVGKGAAMLYVLLGVREVYSPVMSTCAVEAFRKFSISYSFDNEVPRIINRKGDGLCPIESAVKDIFSPEEALYLIKQKLKELQ